MGVENVSHLTSKNQNKKKPIIIGLVIFIVVVFVLGLFALKQLKKDDNSYYIKIGNNIYTKAEIDELTIYYRDIYIKDQATAETELINDLKYVTAADQMNINVTKDEINEQIQKLNKAIDKNSVNKYTKTVELISKKNAIYEKLSNSGLEGYVFDFYFGQHIVSGPSYKPDGWNDPTLISQDKKYAKDRAEYYYRNLAEKKINTDQALKEILSDPKLGNSKKETSNNSALYKSSRNNDDQISSIQDESTKVLRDQKNVGLSEIKIAKGPSLVPSVDDTQQVELRYYFTYANKIGSSSISVAELATKSQKIEVVYAK